MLPIVNAPHDALSRKADKVNKLDQPTKALLKDMEEALLNATDPEGVGLAAPQVGKSLQIFLIKESPDATLKFFINPVLTIPDGISLQKKTPRSKRTNKKKGVTLEGCLSLKDIWGVVQRYPKVHLIWIDENGMEHKKMFNGFMATIVQHEYDHLQGILFPKRVLEQKNTLYKSVKDENDETVFEEISI